MHTTGNECKTYLLAKIDKKRAKMLDTAERFGMGNFHTLKVSQELDELILKYQRMKQNTMSD